MPIGGISFGYGNSYAYGSYMGNSVSDRGNGIELPGMKQADPSGKEAGVEKATMAVGSGLTKRTSEAESIPGMKGKSDDDDKVNGKSKPGECKTCQERTYVDGSDENVSFKAARHLSPTAAPAAVSAHEGEHVANAYTKAAQNNGTVINASVTIHTGVCPECGRTYVAGGTTHTTIKYPNESNQYVQQKKAQDALKLRGKNIDFVA